jgi:hypothetical protein
MKELRELDVPWADDEPAIGGSVPRRAAGRPVRSLDEHRLRRRGVIVAAVGLAAAACVAVVLLLVNTGGVPSQEAASSPAFAQGAGAPAVTGADLNALTTRLAGGTRAPSSKASASGVFGAAPATPGGGAPPLPASPTIAPAAVAGVSCARRASGQSDSAVVVYANVAVFQGKRVWVVGFVTTPTSGGTPRLEIVAATTSGCTVVYVGRAPLAATP